MRGLSSAVRVRDGRGCLQNSPFKQLLSSSGRKSSSKRRVIGPLPGNRCLAVGVVKPAGFWSNSNTFFISCLFLLNPRPRNRSVTGSLHTQPCFRPAPLGSNQREPRHPQRNFCISSCTFKVSRRRPPPAPPSPPRTPRTSLAAPEQPTATRKRLKHPPNKRGFWIQALQKEEGYRSFKIGNNVGKVSFLFVYNRKSYKDFFTLKIIILVRFTTLHLFIINTCNWINSFLA